jgi:hypothetical protein
LAARSKAATVQHDAATVGTMGATRHFYHCERGRIDAWMVPVQRRDVTCTDMADEAF